jgi:hypothetical protein
MKTLLTIALVCVSLGWYVDHSTNDRRALISASTPLDSIGRIDPEKDRDHIEKICRALCGVPYPDPNGGNDAATLPWLHAQECSEFMNAERWSLVTGEATTGELPPRV